MHRTYNELYNYLQLKVRMYKNIPNKYVIGNVFICIYVLPIFY